MENSENLNSLPDSNSEQEFIFDGDRVTSSWVQPEMTDVICNICGKRCKERGAPLCVNANPYCG
jgi:hypothetical protein